MFCSGADRRELRNADGLARITDRLEWVLAMIASLPKPVVCRVNGDAYGAGLAILATADLAFTVRSARFALPEVRFGLVASAAAPVCVPKIGLTAALDLLLTGRTIDGTEAAALGLVAGCTEDEPALDALLAARLQVLLAGDADALRRTKDLIHRLASPCAATNRLLSCDARHERAKARLIRVVGRKRSSNAPGRAPNRHASVNVEVDEGGPPRA